MCWCRPSVPAPSSEWSTSEDAKLGNIAYEMTLFANRAGAALTPQLVLELKNSVGTSSAR